MDQYLVSLQQGVVSVLWIPLPFATFLQYKQTRTFLPFVFFSLETCSYVGLVLSLLVCEFVFESWPEDGVKFDSILIFI